MANFLEVFVNEGLCLRLFEAVCFRAWVCREKKFEARRAIVVIIRVTHARVWPCDAVRTPETAAVLDTLVCLPHSTLLASLDQTASSSAVYYARV